MGDGDTDAAVILASLRVPSSFAKLFDRHFDAIYSYLRRRVGEQLAEDLAAQTFEEAFRLRARYDLTRGDARPWLYGIATNLGATTGDRNTDAFWRTRDYPVKRPKQM